MIIQYLNHSAILCLINLYIFILSYLSPSGNSPHTATKKQNKKDHPMLVNSTTTLTDITLNEIIYSIWRV